MADIFDKIVVGINKGVTSVGANSKAMVKRAKIKTAIEGIESERVQLVQLLGQKVYDICVATGEISTDEVRGFVAQIQQRVEHIAQQEEQLRLVDEEVSAATGSVASAAPVGAFCSCGHTNQAVAKFCAKCGNHL